VGYEFYHQIIKQYSRRLSLKLICYLGVLLASLARVIRFGMIAAMAKSVVTIDVLYFITELFIYAAYSALLYIWTLSYLIAHRKSNFWIWGVRGAVIGTNTSFWIATYAVLGKNPPAFTAGFNPTIIVGVMLISGGVMFLVLAKTMEMVAKDDTELMVGIESAAQKISKHTYWTCVAVFIMGLVFIMLSATAFEANTITYFMIRHGIYRVIEIGLLVGMVLILHQKPRKPNVNLHISSSQSALAGSSLSTQSSLIKSNSSQFV